MVGITRLKVIAFWGFLLFLVTNGSVFLLTLIFGQITSLLATIPIETIFAGFAGYKATTSLIGTPNMDKKFQLTLVGVIVAIFGGLLSSALNYFLTGKLEFGGGAFTILAAAIGGYIAERKSGSTTKFFGR